MKINSKWIEVLNIRKGTIKLLEEKREKKLYDIGYIDDFIDMMPKKGNKNKNEKVGPQD